MRSGTVREGFWSWILHSVYEKWQIFDWSPCSDNQVCLFPATTLLGQEQASAWQMENGLELFPSVNVRVSKTINILILIPEIFLCIAQNYIYPYSEVSSVQQLVGKNQAECCIFGFLCVGFREIQLKGLNKRSGSGMLFTAGGKMLIHSNSSSLCIKRGYCHAFVLMQGFAITYPAKTLDWKAVILAEKSRKNHEFHTLRPLWHF